MAHRILRVFQNTIRMHFAYTPHQWEGSMFIIRALRRTDGALEFRIGRHLLTAAYT